MRETDHTGLFRQKLALLHEYRKLTEQLFHTLNTSPSLKSESFLSENTANDPATPVRRDPGSDPGSIPEGTDAGQSENETGGTPPVADEMLMQNVEKILAARQQLIERIDALDHVLTESGGHFDAPEAFQPVLEEIRLLEQRSRELLERRYREWKDKITRLQAGRKALHYLKRNTGHGGLMNTVR